MLKHLNIDEMVALFTPWVSNTKRKSLFLSIPEIAALHSKAVLAHKAVLAVRPAKAVMSPALRAIADQMVEDDRVHDHLARAITLGLESHREYCLAADTSDVARAATCDELNTKLFPSGMNIINASPLAESGNTARVAQLLEGEPDSVKLLKSIPAPNKTSLYNTVERWIAAGTKLEELEHKREELLAKEATTPITKATQQAARSQWFRIASLVLSNLAESDAPAEAIETIRGPILRASDRAGKRYAAGKPGDVVLDPEEGTEA